MKKNVAIELINITGGYNNEIVIENINCKIYDGDFFGIIGPNGGGKSTLLKIILGLLNPMEGTVRIFGQLPENGRKNIGYVPQYSEYDKQYPISVWDVVLMGRRIISGFHPLYSAADKKATNEELKRVNMEKYKNRHISELSGGQRQRVFIARALVAKPKILLLDEPTASIDKDLQTNFYKLLKQLNKDVTIVLVTHDIGVISAYVNRVACLNHYIFTHNEKMISKEMLEATYSCPVDLIAHGLPHRVLDEHKSKEKS
jgi:zinc transport system ATP-binding protein